MPALCQNVCSQNSQTCEVDRKFMQEFPLFLFKTTTCRLGRSCSCSEGAEEGGREAMDTNLSPKVQKLTESSFPVTPH